MIAFWLLLLPLPAQAACEDLRIQNLQHVDFSNNPSPTEDFRIRQDKNGECEFFVTVDNGGASSSQARKLYHDNRVDSVPVQICLDSTCSTVIKPIQEATSNADLITGKFNQGGENTATFLFRPRLGQTDYARYGDYEANFTMRLYEGTLTGSHSLQDTESFRLRYRMNKRIDLSLVDSGAPFDITSTSKSMNFGALSQGQQLNFDLLIKTNAGYRVRMESQNRGRLVSRTASVPYTLSLNGGMVVLDSEVIVAQGAGVSGNGGYRLPGRITISALGDAPAGTYSDSITIRVTTTE